jgi:hypothetical protein
MKAIRAPCWRWRPPRGATWQPRLNGGLNGRLNADQGACMGRGRCNEEKQPATGCDLGSPLKERTAMRKITIIIGLAAMLGGCIIFPVPLPVPVPVNTPPAPN